MGYYFLSFLMIFSLSGAFYAAEAGGKIGMKSGKSEKVTSAPKGKAPSVQSKGGGHKKGSGKHGVGRHGRHKKSPYFPNPLFPVYGYYGYYYPNDYSYSDPEHPLGYGTTLGTTLSRESNIEVNRGLAKPGPSNNVQTYEDVEVYSDYAPGAYNPAGQPSGSGTIYVWTDEDGVDNYVNDIELVPAARRESVRIISGD
ncbi:MAG TPA: hypothetical protein PKC29_07475 [Thermodesulfobacteriota bacterium]|nr:hypothetical protein [Thermodesulfobacteriota bacterium]